MRVNRQTNEISFSRRRAHQSFVATDRHRVGPQHSSRGSTTQLVPLRRADPAKVREAITAIRDAALRTAREKHGGGPGLSAAGRATPPIWCP